MQAILSIWHVAGAAKALANSSKADLQVMQELDSKWQGPPATCGVMTTLQIDHQQQSAMRVSPEVILHQMAHNC